MGKLRTKLLKLAVVDIRELDCTLQKLLSTILIKINIHNDNGESSVEHKHFWMPEFYGLKLDIRILSCEHTKPKSAEREMDEGDGRAGGGLDRIETMDVACCHHNVDHIYMLVNHLHDVKFLMTNRERTSNRRWRERKRALA